jgi:hypothetical protein
MNKKSNFVPISLEEISKKMSSEDVDLVQLIKTEYPHFTSEQINEQITYLVFGRNWNICRYRYYVPPYAEEESETHVDEKSPM